MDKNKSIISYCTGCGACKSAQLANLRKNFNGFCIAEPTNKDFNIFCRQIYFSQGMQYRGISSNKIWGKVLHSYYAWSADANIRYKASSGGTITALCIYLLESRRVNGIVHTAVDPNSPIGTISVCSTTKDELIERCGSRYSSSSPLCDIYKYLGTGKKYCFVGKPCDVATLRNLMHYDNRFKKTFPILISFYCAGVPSEKANLSLLHKLNVELDKCVSLKYRGDGWPGYATAIDIYGDAHKMYYRNAWRDTLGRDIRKICRFCSDGIGEMADIVCFDAWYTDKDNKPVFDEADGRNGVFCRSNIGLEIFEEAVKRGYLIAHDYLEYNKDLPYYQAYQHDRRSTLSVCILALTMFFKQSPRYPFILIFKLAKNSGLRIQWRRFKGTVQRIRQGKI